MRILDGRLGLALALATACSPTVTSHGVPNLAQVNAGVWRSGQITTREGWNYIRQIAAGRRVHVLKLNYPDEGSDAEAVAMGFDVHELAIEPHGDRDVWNDLVSAFTQPNPTLVHAAETLLETATADDLWLVHCTHGQDRTGYIIGRYRVLHDGWPKVRAYDEMRAHHFHPALHGVHEAWERFVP